MKFPDATPLHRSTTPLLRLLCLLLFALLATPLSAAVTAKLNRDTIRVGENAILSLTFADESPPSAPNVNPPPGLTIGYIGQSSQITIVGGRRSGSVSYNYSLAASKPGTYTIPSIQVRVGQQTFSTQPLTLKVLASAAPDPATQDQLNQLAFVKLVPAKKEVYAGEVLPFEIQLFIQNGRDLAAPEINSPGFVVGKLGQHTQDRVRFGNAIYNRVTMPGTAIPLNPGKHKFGPATWSLKLLVQRQSRDPFENFLGGRVDVHPVTLNSDAHEITVLPLPAEGKPADFSGTVGSFEMAASASPTEVAVGDPITLRIQIAGNGPLDSLKEPTAEWRDFKVYPPNVNVQPTDNLGVVGVKTFEQVVVPENADVKELPALSFSFFDPGKKAYRTLRHPATPLKVRPATAQAQPTVLANPTAQTKSAEPAREIIHIKPHLGVVTALQSPLITRPWFIGLHLVPIAAWISLVIWRKRRDAIANDPRLRRRREVAKTIDAGLDQLREHAAANDSPQFFATVFRLVQEQLGERLDLPASSITESVIDDQLRPRGVKPELADALHELFQTCNQARYAPITTTAEFNSMVTRVESLLAQLKDLNLEAPR
ncbi:MAG: BatD family protein [Verrucomicrobiota bacterium]